MYFEFSAVAVPPTTLTSTAPTYIKISTDSTYIDYVLILLTHIFVLLLRTQLNVYNAYHQVLVVQCKPLYHANQVHRAPRQRISVQRT